MKASTVVAIVCLAAMGIATSFAQATNPPGRKTPRVDAREKVQKERIKEGVKSGELTRREARRLAAEQKKIRVDEAKAKSDGKVTARERAKLNKQLNKASRDIARQKHDRQKRK
jgi:hypothetical protein